MKKTTTRVVTQKELFADLLKRNALIEAHLTTLFAMHCELIAHLTKSDVAPIIDTWSKARMQFLQENLNALTEQFGP